MYDKLVLPMQRGPFQNNGATPWYTTLALGTPGQLLKLAIDTGTNITWTTSTLCPDDQCEHYSAGRFDYQASSTFSFTDCLQRPYSFGPWGTMQVESGTDVLTVDQETSVPAQLFLAAQYSGEQFEQLDWDGGIGVPSSSAYVEGRSSFLLQDLLRTGRIDPSQPFVAFDWDARHKTGTCQMGGVDESKTKGPGLFLPWSVYSKLAGVEYIWSADLKSYSVGGQTLARDIKFALDSGSSQFKGDDTVMRKTKELIASGGMPEVVLGFEDGEITLGADLYNILIEEGPQKGQTLPQFEPLGLQDLVLVGSLVMDHCYTVHEYQVVKCSATTYSLAPVGIWLFNRPDGPQIITRPSSRSFKPGPRKVATRKLVLPAPRRNPEAARSQTPLGSVAGTWTNVYGSTMELSVSNNRVSGIYKSSTGSTGKYEVTGFQVGAMNVQVPDLTGIVTVEDQINHVFGTDDHSSRRDSYAFQDQETRQAEAGIPVALALEWHSISDGAADPSWNWTSGLTGQISVVNGEEILTLSHLLEATSDFPQLAERGTYLDKLTYRRVSDSITAAQPVIQARGPQRENALNGDWETIDGELLRLQVHASSEHRFGKVQGQFITANDSLEVSGFTDINTTASGLNLQSVSLTAAQKSTVICLSGSLDLTSNELNLLMLKSSPTTASNSYLQTRIVAVRLQRKTA